MGAFLDKPKTEKHNEHGKGNGLHYGLSSMQGWRIEMEDAHSAIANLPGELKDWAFFAVFDGHAGARVSSHCSEHLLQSITSGDEFQASSVANLTSESADKTISSLKKGIHTGFLRLDESMRQMPEVASGEDKSGTTAVCALISPSHIFVANCGDSRGVLYRKTGIGFSTQDHKPVNPTEKERIQNAGGSVMIQRVNGSLAVSRALGDYEYKNVEGKSPTEQLVSPEPEIYVERRQSDDEFLVLACDGVWDVMTNEDLCAYVRSRLLISEDLEAISNQIVDTCLYKGSRDNMSIVLIMLPGSPKLSQDAIKKEKDLEDLIEKTVTDLCQSEGAVTMPQIMQALSDENITSLPPGGGLPAKRGFVEQIFRKLRPDCANSESMDEVDDGLGGNLVFLPSTSMRDKLSAIIEKSSVSDDAS